MILGINASGWSAVCNDQGILVKGVTEDLLKHILRETGESHEYVHLGGKTIEGCQGCLRCAGDNICKVQDDWAEIRDRMLQADAIVFGVPLFYGTINALGHAFLERTFSLRHGSRFPLAGKLNAILTVGKEEPNPAEDYIEAIYSGATTWPPPSEPSAPGESPNATHAATEKTAPPEQWYPATGSSTRSEDTTPP